MVFGVHLSPALLVHLQMGLVDISAGVGHANTSVAYHAGRLLALHEVGSALFVYMEKELYCKRA